MLRHLLAFGIVLLGIVALGQVVPQPPLVPVSLTDEIGMAMNKAQVMDAALQAWSVSFGQQPGAKKLIHDIENNVIEGTARVNFRSKAITFREETMGSITYTVSIKAVNGQCNVRVHNFRHTGNRNAPDGGLDLGVICEADAPLVHYEGMGLGLSRKLHADARKAAMDKAQEVLRAFSARLRLLGGQK